MHNVTLYVKAPAVIFYLKTAWLLQRRHRRPQQRTGYPNPSKSPVLRILQTYEYLTNMCTESMPLRWKRHDCVQHCKFSKLYWRCIG